MDFQKLFLSAEGRIGRGEFWAGWCILFVVNMVLHFIPIIGWFAGLALIYCWVCVYAKRLHDMGKSGWLQLIPMAILFGGIIFAIVAGVGAAITANASNGSDAAGMAALGGFGVMALVLCLCLIVGIGFLLWVGLSQGEPGDNRYGPPPTSTATSPPPPATVG
jgi:uncharacterized membrane protein YhaH (DUF805 family)